MYNDKQHKSTRKVLRTNMTPQEVVLWSRLKGNQLDYKFRRQYGVGNYIMDFYCPKKRLAVEVDGSQHFTQEHHTYDAQRTQFLQEDNITVLRVTNKEINTNIEGVVMKIREMLNTPQSPKVDSSPT